MHTPTDGTRNTKNAGCVMAERREVFSGFFFFLVAVNDTGDVLGTVSVFATGVASEGGGVIDITGSVVVSVFRVFVDLTFFVRFYLKLNRISSPIPNKITSLDIAISFPDAGYCFMSINRGPGP